MDRLDNMSVGRFFSAIARRLRDIPHNISWEFDLQKSKEYKNKLLQAKNSHKHERCFIIGNGPSLKFMNLDLLENEIAFGLNRVYLLFDKFRFRPKYLVSINELVLKQFSTEISNLKIEKFLNWSSRSYFPFNDRRNNFIKLNLGLQDGFQKDITKPVFSGGTVTYVAMQLAYWMGFEEVILIGIDHYFEDKGTPNKTEVRKVEVDQNHFHPNYFPKGVKWQLPDLLRSEIAYRMAREEFEKDGRRIVDATIGGHLNVFPKVDYYKIVKR